MKVSQIKEQTRERGNRRGMASRVLRYDSRLQTVHRPAAARFMEPKVSLPGWLSSHQTDSLFGSPGDGLTAPKLPGFAGLSGRLLSF